MKKLLVIFTFLIVLLSLYAIGGDTAATAVQVMTLPFNDTGDTTNLSNTIANSSNDAFIKLVMVSN